MSARVLTSRVAISLNSASGIAPMSPLERSSTATLALFHLAVAAGEHERNPLQLRVANLRAEARSPRVFNSTPKARRTTDRRLRLKLRAKPGGEERPYPNVSSRKGI